MGSARNSNNTRKARIEEMRRAEQARERRNRVLTVAGVAVVVAALVGGGFLLVSKAGDDKGGKDDGKPLAEPAVPSTVGKDGVTSFEAKKLKRDHVTENVTYSMTPPVGGKHHPAWLNCNGDVYEEAVPEVNAVHSLEHGAVWVTYTSKAPKAELAKLAAKVKKTPYSLMSPVEGQKDPIMLSAWGKQRTVQGADDPNLNKFFADFVQGPQTPEPGAACTGGVSK